MRVNAIFSECSLPLWIDVADNLTKRYNWNPCYWIGDPDFGKQVKKKFPNIVYHSNLDAVRGIPSTECINLQLPAIDQPLIRNLSFAETIALRMMNRMDRNNYFSFDEREHLYYTYLKYWSAVLDRFKPQVVLFSVSSHLIYDYVLYTLCKQRHIHTIIFEQTALDGWIFPEEHFEVGSEQLKSMYTTMKTSWEQGNHTMKLTKQATEYLSRLSSDYSTAQPFYMKDQEAKKNLPKYLIKKLLESPDNIPQMIRKGKYLFSRGHYIKEKGKNIRQSDMYGWKYLFCKIEGIQKKNMLVKHYAIMEKPVDFNQPYLYYPLHYQPENTTSPLGEVYADQLLIVDILSKSIPVGWHVYVKEHSSQWHPKLHGECSRTSEFYDDVVSFPNVQLIPLSTSNFDLIDHAKAVVTVTGTAGWEAVVRGKPALIFGHAWYKFCEGVFYIESEHDCKEAVAKIHSGYSVNKDLVKLFLSAVQQISINAYVDPSYENIVDVSIDQNISRLVDSIQKFYLFLLQKNKRST